MSWVIQPGSPDDHINYSGKTTPSGYVKGRPTPLLPLFYVRPSGQKHFAYIAVPQFGCNVNRRLQSLENRARLNSRWEK